jgi:hypothetical protein
MSKIRIGQMSVDSSSQDSARAVWLARRAAELLGKELAGGDAVQAVPRLDVEVRVEAGLSDERIAQIIARRVLGRLT